MMVGISLFSCTEGTFGGAGKSRPTPSTKNALPKKVTDLNSNPAISFDTFAKMSVVDQGKVATRDLLAIALSRAQNATKVINGYSFANLREALESLDPEYDALVEEFPTFGDFFLIDAQNVDGINLDYYDQGLQLLSVQLSSGLAIPATNQNNNLKPIFLMSVISLSLLRSSESALRLIAEGDNHEDSTLGKASIDAYARSSTPKIEDKQFEYFPPDAEDGPNATGVCVDMTTCTIVPMSKCACGPRGA